MSDIEAIFRRFSDSECEHAYPSATGRDAAIRLVELLLKAELRQVARVSCSDFGKFVVDVGPCTFSQIATENAPQPDFGSDSKPESVYGPTWRVSLPDTPFFTYTPGAEDENLIEQVIVIVGRKPERCTCWRIEPISVQEGWVRLPFRCTCGYVDHIPPHSIAAAGDAPQDVTD